MITPLPDDALGAVFTSDVLARLHRQRNPTRLLVDRLAVLTADGLMAIDRLTRCQMQHSRARKAAWDAYLHAAFVCGLIDRDMVSRLTGTDDEGFRSAMSECMACWFLAGKLGLSVRRPSVVTGRSPDFEVVREESTFAVEVKAPYTEPITEGGFYGDDSEMLAACVDEANEQFRHGQPNVLLIVPTTKMGFPLRYELVKAFLVEAKIVVRFNRATGEPVGDPTTEFFHEGRFLKVWKGDNPKPRFTRVSAVVCLGERVVDVDKPNHPTPQSAWVDHHWLVVHNPYCPFPVPTKIWGSAPQLVHDDQKMWWTDGHIVDS